MRGVIRKRAKASWEVRIETGKDAAGNRLFDYITVRGTREEAEREITKRVGDVNAGAYVESSKTTVAEFLDRWLSTYAEGNVSAKTYEGYRSMIEHHFKPAFGLLPLQKLTPFAIQSHYATIRKAGGRKDGREGGLNPRTVLHQHRLLSEVLEMAVQWQVLIRNPCDAVVPPKLDDREVQVITETETAWLIRSAEGTRLHLPIMLTTCAGLRRGEILAATWADVDRQRRILRITRAVSEPKKNVICSKNRRASGPAVSRSRLCCLKLWTRTAKSKMRIARHLVRSTRRAI